MAYVVDRVVICDAYSKPTAHYRLLSGGKSRLEEGRRPSMRFLASGKDVRGGIGGIVGRQASLLEDNLAKHEEQNSFVNGLRDEVEVWRDSGYPNTAIVTRRLLEWWFERDEERKAEAKRLFFCQQEAVETIIYLYEVQNRRNMPKTGDLLRYALKLATGTGKTVVMATLIVWATLHKRKVSGSTLSANFLVLVPNLTVKQRVSGDPRGDGLDPAGGNNLYDQFDMVPPEYHDEFEPNVLVRNWQGIPLESARDDWTQEEPVEDGRFIPASVLWAMRRRARRDPDAAIRRTLKGWRDLVIINDEAHHVYGEKRAKKAEEPEYIKWSKIIERIQRVVQLSLVIDVTATPWYGSGSPKPEGTLFEWLVSDFSVYDAFESGLVKIVRLPDPDEDGRIYLDLWDQVKEARTEQEYISACKGAIASMYASWRKDFQDWSQTFENMRGPSPVMLIVTSDGTKAKWIFDHLTKDYDLLRNPDDEDRSKWVSIQIDSKVFDAEKGKEATIREMVATVGSEGMPGEHVRCIVSVNMLSEGWDVKSVTHILGLRAFGSPLLTEQIIGRGLRRTNYDVLNQPLDERPDGYEETVDAFGIPFIGFPVQKRKRPRTGQWGGTPVWIEIEEAREKNRIRIPNVRAWAVGITEPLRDLIRVHELPSLKITAKETPAEVMVKPVVGGKPEAVLTLEEFRREWPLLRSEFMLAGELLERCAPDDAADLGTGPTFDELLEVVRAYVSERVSAEGNSTKQDVGIYYWRQRALNVLETAIRNVGTGSLRAVPVLGDPDWLDTQRLKRFQWTGIVYEGKKTHTNRVPCHSDLEKQFASFLDGKKAKDVIRYFKNERFGFSVTYYENNRPRQYFPDFIVLVRERDGRECHWIVETKGEIRTNTALKRQAANLWCERMSTTQHGLWRHLFVQQRKFEKALSAGIDTFAQLVDALVKPAKEPQLQLISDEDPRVETEKYQTLLPLYTLKAAAGYFGNGEAVEPEGWIEADGYNNLDEKMFVAKAVGQSMEPEIKDGEYLVFRSDPVGSRQGKIVLAQYRGEADPDTGGAFTVKRYYSEKTVTNDEEWEHSQIVLRPKNSKFSPIEIDSESADDFKIVAEFLGALRA